MAYVKSVARSRVALAAAALASMCAYLLILDLGVHAGRVHRGVHVGGFDIGGLTEQEAGAVLTDRQEFLEGMPVVLVANGFDCRTLPEDVGWDPKPFNTAGAAMEVGRSGLWSGLVERIEGWFGGVKVGWAGTVDPSEVDDFLEYCQENADVLGVEVDRAKLRYRLRRAIVTWPRSSIDFKVPLVREAG